MRANCATIFRWKSFLAVVGPAASFGDVWGQVVPILPNVPTSDTTIGTTLCAVASWSLGNLGIGLAVIGISILGILIMYGKIGWGTALVTGAGISAIFGAPALLGTASCGATYPNSDILAHGGLGGVLGVQTSAFLNLADTGSVSKAASGYPTIQVWFNPVNQYNSSGNLTYAAGELGATTRLNPPINGWLQVQYSGLPVGWTVGPMYPWQGTGVNSNGDAFVNDGYYTVYGNNQNMGYIDTGVILYQPNGQPATSQPSGITVTYTLFSNSNAYFSGCTTGACSVTSQYQWSVNTSVPNGNGSAATTDTKCTTSSCIAPPL